MSVITDLMNLQKLEIQLSVLDKRENELKNNNDIAALRELETATLSLLEKGNRLMKQNETKSKELQLQINSYHEQIKQDDSLLYSGKIINSRELEDLQQKINDERERLDKLEEQQLELFDKCEKYTRKISKETKRLQQCQSELATLETEQRQNLGELALARFELQSHCEELSELLPNEKLQQYRRIAESHRGIGIASLTGDVCGACHVGQSDETLKKVRRATAEFVFCDNCGRIICNC